jgi:hypothetical protein
MCPHMHASSKKCSILSKMCWPYEGKEKGITNRNEV